MPSVDTIIADLTNGIITGIGQKPDSGHENARSVISATHQLTHSAVHIKAAISATNRLTLASARNSSDFNGNYVHFADGMATAGTMDLNRPLVISGNFSGCLWRIYRAPPPGMPSGKLYDIFKCVHIARPFGAGADAVVAQVTSYATAEGWTLIQEVPSVGFIPPKGEVVMVSRMTHNVQIDTVRLEIDNTGVIQGTTLFTDPI